MYHMFNNSNQFEIVPITNPDFPADADQYALGVAGNNPYALAYEDGQDT